MVSFPQIKFLSLSIMTHDSGRMEDVQDFTVNNYILNGTIFTKNIYWIIK